MTRPSRILLAVVMSMAVTVSAQQSKFTFSGQFWGAGAYGDDPAPMYKNYEGLLGYIPTINLQPSMQRRIEVEVEWAYRYASLLLSDSADGNWQARESKNHYRMWLRLSAAKWEFRLGRQKISYGPAQLLRPLAWYDTFDLRDPTGQTRGVDAARLRLFPSSNLVLWGWLQAPDVTDDWQIKTLSPGARVEYLIGVSEIGATWAYRPEEGTFGEGQIPTLTTGPGTRLAIDFRTDNIIGLWGEGVVALGAEREGYFQRNTVWMIGADYTFAVGNGVGVMLEYIQGNYAESPDLADIDFKAMALIGSLPMGLMDMVLAVWQYDPVNQQSFQYIMWQRTFDHLAMNTIFFANPGRDELAFASTSGGSSVGIGAGIQLLLTYHH